MKTFVTHNGIQLEENSAFTHGGVQYAFVYVLSDGAICVRHPLNGTVYAHDGQLGLKLYVMPNHIIMNRRTGAEVVAGDLLPNGHVVERIDNNGYVGCRNGIRYNWNSMSRQVDYVTRTRFDQTPPAVPEYRRGCEFDPPRATGHMLINGEWRPYRSVRQHNGEYYWEGESVLVNNSVVPLADTVIGFTGDRLLASEAVLFEEQHYHVSDCADIGGTLYPRVRCLTVVDEDCSVIEWLPPGTPMDDYALCRWIGNGVSAYADPDTVVEVGCDGFHPAGDTREWRDEDYPEQWIDDNTFVCGGCGERFHNDEYDEDGRCADCYEEYRDDDDEYGDGDSRIRDCSCRTAARYTPEEDIPLKFGIEFEVESRSGRRSELLDHFDDALPERYAIYKSDGSLSDSTGVEIVTRPDSPAVHKRVWRGALDENAQALLSISDCCGIHIHVSRAPLSPLRIGRMLVFVNEPGNEPLIRKVAGRYNRSYCELQHDKKLSDGKRIGCSRYDGLNLSGSHTIEFRLFDSRSSGTPDGFIKNIEFVEALLAFTNIAECGNRSLDTESFMAFLNRRRKDYPVLHKFLNPAPAAVTTGN